VVPQGFVKTVCTGKMRAKNQEPGAERKKSRGKKRKAEEKETKRKKNKRRRTEKKNREEEPSHRTELKRGKQNKHHSRGFLIFAEEQFLGIPKNSWVFFFAIFLGIPKNSWVFFFAIRLTRVFLTSSEVIIQKRTKILGVI